MTIIVYRDGVMAADTGIFNGDVLSGEMEKIFQLDDGTLYGSAGFMADDEPFHAWVREGVRPDRLSSDFSGLVIKPDGTVLEVGGPTPTMFQTRAPFYTLGCGSEIAIGALEFGATAVQAVQAACRRSVFCREPITVLSLGNGNRKIKCPECREPAVREIAYPNSRAYVCHHCWHGWRVTDYVKPQPITEDARFGWDGGK